MSDYIIEILENAGKKAGCDFELIYIFLCDNGCPDLLENFVDFCAKYAEMEG